jgi:hypothetical protein
MEKYCFSCGSPLWMEPFQGPADDYCKYCTDENGNLKSREEILQGCANWLKSWSPGLDDETAIERAEHYMQSMPEWADK